MSRLAERHAVQRIGTRARGQRAHDGVGQPLDDAIERVRALDALGDERPAGRAGRAYGFCVTAGR